MPNHYVTGSAIRRLREKRRLTQAQLAAALSVRDKTVSKWETARGVPDTGCAASWWRVSFMSRWSIR